MGSKGASRNMDKPLKRDTMYVTVAEHDPIEVSECGRYLRSRHEPECVVDLETCGKWVRLAATPLDAARQRRRLVRVEDLGDLAHGPEVDESGGGDIDEQQQQHDGSIKATARPGRKRGRTAAAALLFVVSAAGAAVAIGQFARGEDLTRAVDGARAAATWLLSNVSWSFDPQAHLQQWSCDM